MVYHGPQAYGTISSQEPLEHLQEVIYIFQSIQAECLCEIHLNLNHIVMIPLLLNRPVSATDATCYLQQPTWNHVFISRLM